LAAEPQAIAERRHRLRIETAQMRRFCAYHGNRISPWLVAQIRRI
jgi:hypothetical protein